MILQKSEKVLFFLTILFLPTQLGKHFWPEFSFVYSIPIDYLSPVIYFWDVLVLLLLTSFILQKKKFKVLPLNIFYLFFLSQLVSLFFADSIAVGIVRAEQYFIAGSLGLYLASSKFSIQSRKLYIPMSLAIIGESILAIAQFFKGATVGLWIFGERSFSLSTPAIAKFDFYNQEFLRPYGTFPHPNVLAAFLIIGFLILVINLQKGILIKAISAVSGMALLMSVSRTAIFVGFFSLLLLLKGKIRIFFLLLILVLSPILYQRYSSLFNFDNLTLIRRVDLISISINLWTQDYFFGIGLNNFIPKVADILLSGPSRFLQPVHNIIFLALSETGIFGLLGWTVLIGFPIYKLMRLTTNSKSKKYFLAIWIAVLFLGQFDHYFLTLPQGYRTLFLVWGLSFSMLE